MVITEGGVTIASTEVWNMNWNEQLRQGGVRHGIGRTAYVDMKIPRNYVRRNALEKYQWTKA